MNRRPWFTSVFLFSVLIFGNVCCDSSDTWFRTWLDDPGIIANAGIDRTVPPGIDVVLVGQNARKTQVNDFLTYTWTVVSTPMSNFNFSWVDGNRAGVFPWLMGTYTFKLTINSEHFGSDSDYVTIFVTNPAHLMLDYGVADGVYSSTFDRIVLLSSDAAELHFINPHDFSDNSLALPYPGNCMDIDPTGKNAVIGHDGHVSLISLSNGSITATYPVGGFVVSVVAATNNHAYIAATNSGGAGLFSLCFTNGIVTTPWVATTKGLKIKSHPSGKYLYGVVQGLTPQIGILKYAITNQDPVFLYSSFAHAEHLMGNNFWISSSGLYLFCNEGILFNLSEDFSTDLTINNDPYPVTFSYYDLVFDDKDLPMLLINSDGWSVAEIPGWNAAATAWYIPPVRYDGYEIIRPKAVRIFKAAGDSRFCLFRFQDTGRFGIMPF